MATFWSRMARPNPPSFEILDSGKLKLATKEPEAIRADAVVCIEVNLNAALGTMKDIKKPDDEENP